MSLNWQEINCILQELALSGAYVKDVAQPHFDNLLWLLRCGNGQIVLRASHAAGRCALHRSQRPFRRSTPTRLVQLLRARVRYGRIRSVYQLNCDRVVRIVIDKDGVLTYIWIRLWSGAANTIVTNSELVIIDSLYRRPLRGEVSGARFVPLKEMGAPAKSYAIRPYTTSDFNCWVDRHYREKEEEQYKKKIYHKVQTVVMDAIRTSHRQMHAPTEDNAQHYRWCGQLLLAHISEIEITNQSSWVTVKENAQEYSIRINPRRSIAENAQQYFKDYKDAVRQNTHRIEHAQRATKQYHAQVAILNALPQYSLHQMLSLLKKYTAPSIPTHRRGAYHFCSHRYTMYVGRSAKQNESVVREARPHDMWLHARGASGSSVIIRAQGRGSIPQEVLVDAAMLALYYSNDRKNGAGEVQYTQVKFLNTPKNSAPGTFIPYREKNISIILEENRIQQLHNQQR